MPFLVTYNVPNPPAPSAVPSQPASSEPPPTPGSSDATNQDVETRPPAPPPPPSAAALPTAANIVNTLIPDMAILVNARFPLNRATFTSIRNVISFVFMVSAWLGALCGFKSSTGLTLPGASNISSGARAMGLDGIARLLERMRGNGPGHTIVSANMTALENQTPCGYHEVTTPTPNVDAIEKIMLGLTQLYDLENKRLRHIIEILSQDNTQANEKLAILEQELKDTQRQLNDSRFREFVDNNRWESEKRSWEAEKLQLQAQIEDEKAMREEQQRLDAAVLMLFLVAVAALYLLRAWGRNYRRQLRQSTQ